MRRTPALALGALLAATAAAYLPALDGPFVVDDDGLLAEPLVRAPLEHGPAAWWAAARPVGVLTFALDHAAVGVDPRGWHLTNLAIHLCAVVLVGLLARKSLGRAGLERPDWAALAAAALFALHPLQTESVAYLSQRAESLAAALYLLALLLLLARDEAPSAGRRRALLAAAAAAQLAGALTKPILATLPLAWLLHAAILPAPGEAARGALRRVRDRLGAAAPLLAISVGSAIRELSRTAGSASEGLGVPGLPPLAYLATQLRVIPTYLRLAVWPAGQCVDWDVRPSAGLADPAALGGGLFLAALVAGALVAVRRAAGRAGDGAAAARSGSFGVLFFLLSLAPSSSVVPLKDVLAEHRVYLGLAGLALAAAAAATWALRRAAGPRALLAGAALAAVLLVALGALGAATARRAAVWSTRLALWSDAARKSPAKARVQMNLGATLFQEGRPEEALAALRRARALGDPSADADKILGNLVTVLLATGQEDSARRELEAELRDHPRSAPALGRLAEVEFFAGRTREAAELARRALALDPRDATALTYLGFIRADEGALETARALLRAAAVERPHDLRILVELGRVEARLGDRAAACAAFGRAAADPAPAVVRDAAQRSWREAGCR